MKTKQKSDESGAETVKVAGAALRGILRKITAVSRTFAQCSVEKFSVVHSVSCAAVSSPNAVLGAI